MIYIFKIQQGPALSWNKVNAMKINLYCPVRLYLRTFEPMDKYFISIYIMKPLMNMTASGAAVNLMFKTQNLLIKCFLAIWIPVTLPHLSIIILKVLL